MTYSFRTYLPYYKRNLQVAFPVMLTQLGAAMVGLADSIMVGHYGTTDLAAVSFSNAIFFTVMVFSMGALMGITPLVGHVHGRLEKLLQQGTTDEEIAHKHEQISSYLANGLVFTALVSILSLALLVPCIPYLDYFGQEPDVSACARPYFILIVLSIIPFLLFCFSKQFLEGLGNTFVAMMITVGCNLLNILLNWVFIFGHWGFEPMGAEGAGWATLIARLLMPVCFFIAMACKIEWRRYLRSIRRWMISRREVEHLIALGTPIGLQSFAEALLGNGALHAVRMASTASIHLCLLMNTIGASIMFFFRYQIPYIFTNDPEVVNIASTLLVLGALFQFADGLQCIAAAMLRAIQDVRVPMRIALFAYIGIAPRNISDLPCRSWRQRHVVGVCHRTRYPCRALPYTV